MFVYSKRNVILPGPNGEKFRMPGDYMGAVPAWAEDSAYLRALIRDGKVIPTDTGAAEKKPRKPKEADHAVAG